MNRRQLLAGLLGTGIGKLPIGNLPQRVFEVMNQGGFPVDFTGITDELFRKKMAKVPGVENGVMEIFLREREALAQKCAQIGQSILSELGINPEKGGRIWIARNTPQGNIENPAEILNRWGYPSMSWEDFFKWEGRHTIRGEYSLESDVPLTCHEAGVGAQGNITLEFTPDGTKKLVLYITKKALGIESSSTEGIEMIVRDAQEIQERIFDWKTRDWSQDILKEHKEARERLQESMDKINKQEQKKRETKRINLLHSTTALTSPQQTFEFHEATKKIIAEASQKVGNTFHVHPYYREGIRLSPSPEYYLKKTETDTNTPPLFYS